MGFGWAMQNCARARDVYLMSGDPEKEWSLKAFALGNTIVSALAHVIVP